MSQTGDLPMNVSGGAVNPACLPTFPVHRCYFLLPLLNDYIYDISAVLFLKPPPNTGVIF